MNASEPSSSHRPLLDPHFLPASLWNREFKKQGSQLGTRAISISVLRADGSGNTHHDILLLDTEENRALNLKYLERTLKFLLWSRGGNLVSIEGAPELIAQLQARYSPDGERAFDAQFMTKLFGQPLQIQNSNLKPATLRQTVVENPTPPELRGNRIGFDLGGSDRKCAAVIDGDVVFSEEIKWSPYFESDPRYHFEGIMDSLRRAAAHLPQVDAIGGSSAGVIVNNQIKASSLFRGIPDQLWSSQVENIFHDIATEWNHVPFQVENDGDVSALAGSMALEENGVLGLAMGTSTATGYVDLSGKITGWLTELAFVPIDYQTPAPKDEWSGDDGCAVQYLSQQGVSRLIPASGLEIDSSLDKAQQLLKVQEAMENGDERAEKIYQTVGSYLGYTIPQLACFYDLQQLQLLGRVMSGTGGNLIIETAQKVLNENFPELDHKIVLSTPDEKTKRHGQAIAAASLPSLT